MNFKKPLIETSIQDIYHLAPIPLFKRVFDDNITTSVYNLGNKVLNEQQKRMGQELPGQYDRERQANYGINYDRQEEWVEEHELQPIGSRFFTPPNDFLQNKEAAIFINVTCIPTIELVDAIVNLKIGEKCFWQNLKPTKRLFLVHSKKN